MALLLVEVDGRWLGQRRLVFHGEFGLGLVAHRHGREVGGQTAHPGVVLLHGLDEAVARHRDAVLRPFELHA